MLFENALEMMRKGIPMRRANATTNGRPNPPIKLAEVDGVKCLITRIGQMPAVVTVSVVDILAEDWERADQDATGDTAA